MANNQISAHYPSGARRYITLRNAVGEQWETSSPAWEAMVLANWSTYVVAMTETPADSGLFVATFPSAIAAGRYHVDVHEPQYAAEDGMDPVIETLEVEWDGAAIVTLADRTGFKLAADGVDLIVVEVGMNLRQAAAVAAAGAGGVLAGALTSTVTIAAAGVPLTNRITATVDGTGNRTVVTLNLPV